MGPLEDEEPDVEGVICGGTRCGAVGGGVWWRYGGKMCPPKWGEPNPIPCPRWEGAGVVVADVVLLCPCVPM